MSALICGGDAYIGRHMLNWLAKPLLCATLLENLSTGHREAVKRGELVQADRLEPTPLERKFAGRSFVQPTPEQARRPQPCTTRHPSHKRVIA